MESTPSFLQTKDWAEFQRSLGRPFFEYEQDHISAVVFKYPLPFGKSYLYIPHGPNLDLSRMLGGFKDPVREFVGWLTGLAWREGAIFIKIEPTIGYTAQLLVENGFKKSKKEIQPAKTVIVDLDREEVSLLEAMHHKTRYNIRVAEKHGIRVDESIDANEFWKLIKKTAARDKFSPHPKDYYQKLLESVHGGLMHTKLFLASYDQKPIAAAVILFYGDTGYYLHGALDYQCRQYMAPYLLHWEIIRDLKSKALKHYDLWGIDARRWPGVTRFKLGWIGEVPTLSSPDSVKDSQHARIVEYPGSFDLVTSKIWYLVYNLARKF